MKMFNTLAGAIAAALAVPIAHASETNDRFTVAQANPGGVPRSSQDSPTGSTATPSGHSAGQGAGQSGSATSDSHTYRGAAAGASGGHGDGHQSPSSSTPAPKSTTEPSSHAPSQ